VEACLPGQENLASSAALVDRKNELTIPDVAGAAQRYGYHNRIFCGGSGLQRAFILGVFLGLLGWRRVSGGDWRE